MTGHMTGKVDPELLNLILSLPRSPPEIQHPLPWKYGDVNNL